MNHKIGDKVRALKRLKRPNSYWGGESWKGEKTINEFDSMDGKLVFILDDGFVVYPDEVV